MPSRPVPSAPQERTVPASLFKERCLAMLDQVAMTKEPITVTKRGKPVARVVPLDETRAVDMFGSVQLLSDRDEDYFSTGVRWAAEEEDFEP